MIRLAVFTSSVLAGYTLMDFVLIPLIQWFRFVTY